MLLQSVSQLNPPPTEWLWPGYLAAGSLAILDGDPGQGKSMLTLDVAARLTTGRPWPDGAASPGPAAVVLLCAEDSDSVIRDRLASFSADLARAFLWPRDGDLGLPRLPMDHKRLDQSLTEIALAGAAPRLVVIDPIVAFLDRSIPTSSDAAVRRALAPLARLAEKHRCAILLVRHLTKKANPAALYRGAGSIGFIAACRLAWLAAPDPKADDRFLLAQSKNNYAPLSTTLAYTLVSRLPTVGNQGQQVIPRTTADEAPGAAHEVSGPSAAPCRECDPRRATPPLTWLGPNPLTADELAGQRPRPSRRRVRDFLRRHLAAAPRPAKEILAMARAQGFSRSTLLRAKADLAIQSERTYSNAGRIDYWLLAGQTVPREPSAFPEVDAWLDRLDATYGPKSPLNRDGAA
jgi:hypothetical protein